MFSHDCPLPDLTNQTSPNYNSMYDCRMYDNRWLPVNVSAQMAPLNWYVSNEKNRKIVNFQSKNYYFFFAGVLLFGSIDHL